MPSLSNCTYEKFYVRDNIEKSWASNSEGVPIQFTSQRSAKRFADKYFRRFSIISFDTKTRMAKWRGGERAHR